MCDLVTYRTTGNLTICRTYVKYKRKTNTRFMWTRECHDELQDAMRRVQDLRRNAVFFDVLCGIVWTWTIFPTHVQDQNASSKEQVIKHILQHFTGFISLGSQKMYKDPWRESHEYSEQLVVLPFLRMIIRKFKDRNVDWVRTVICRRPRTVCNVDCGSFVCSLSLCITDLYRFALYLALRIFGENSLIHEINCSCMSCTCALCVSLIRMWKEDKFLYDSGRICYNWKKMKMWVSIAFRSLDCRPTCIDSQLLIF